DADRFYPCRLIMFDVFFERPSKCGQFADCQPGHPSIISRSNQSLDSTAAPGSSHHRIVRRYLLTHRGQGEFHPSGCILWRVAKRGDSMPQGAPPVKQPRTGGLRALSIGPAAACLDALLLLVRACYIRWIDLGAVAQLGERCVRNAEVE